jgi:hypothetical protein
VPFDFRMEIVFILENGKCSIVLKMYTINLRRSFDQITHLKEDVLTGEQISLEITVEVFEVST